MTYVIFFLILLVIVAVLGAATTRSFRVTGSVGGKDFAGTVTRSGESETTFESVTPLPAAKPGELTTRTDADTGTITLEAGHGLTSGDFNIFWDAGIRRKVAATITVNAMAIDGGAGDDLPALNSDVVVSKVVIEDFDSLDTTIVMAMVGQQRRASVEFQQADGTPIKSLDLGRSGDGEPWYWASDQDVATPFSDPIGQIAVSNGSSAGTNTIKAAVLRS